MKFVIILIGSGTGGVARYLLSKGVHTLTSTTFPAGTLTVNLIGSLIIGFLAGLCEYRVISPNMRLLIFTGFLGGFTTFSTFGLESFNLLKDTEIRWALTNVVLTNILGIALVSAGYFFSHLLIGLHK